ncbi:unnamed protein product [Microthlaspi erraticum]|uniref:Uncharacterized protein n=1 Tax=Microthlaspi erraticum TaxID=1685480 RepID=A0A6D2JNX8_9BRAS|nr:unnamed protein product [Microthlaspi erraticum]
MDFIKTSSLRALIELTFQRNWNGIIWMSRKGVMKSEDCPDGYRAHTGGPRNERTAIARTYPHPAKSGRLTSDPGNNVPRSAVPPATTSRARPRARTGKQASRPRTPMYRGRPIRPTGSTSRPAKFHRPNPSVRPRGRPKTSATTVPTVPTTRSDPADRPPTVRTSVDPKPVLNTFSSPA